MPNNTFRDSHLLAKMLKEVPEIISDTCKDLDSQQVNQVKQNHFNNAFDEACQSIKGKGFLDLTSSKLLYSTFKQVRYFAGFIPEQPDLESLLGFFDKHREKFPKEFDIRAYCCGNAVKEGFVFLNESMSGRAKRIFLHDYNENVAEVGLNVVGGLLALLDQQDHLNQAIRSSYNKLISVDDCTDIEQHLPHRLKNNKQEQVHLSLGNIMSLVSNPKEVAITFNKTMNLGELCVQEWYDRKPQDYNTGKLLASNKDFLLNYFEAMGIPRKFIRFDKRIMEDYEEKYNQAYCFLTEDCVVNDHELKKGTKLVGMRLRRFKEEEMLGLFESVGLESVVLEEKASSELAASDVPLNERRVHPLKWEEIGDKRYAIFKKVKEYDPKKWLRRSIITLAAAGVVAAGSLLYGNFKEQEEMYSFLGNPCIMDKFIGNDLKTTCQTRDGKKKEFSLDEIEETKRGLKWKEGSISYSLITRSARDIETVLIYKGVLRELEQGHPITFSIGSYYINFIQGIKECTGGDMNTLIQAIILAKKLEKSNFLYPKEILEPIKNLACSNHREQVDEFLRRASEEKFLRLLGKIDEKYYTYLFDPTVDLHSDVKPASFRNFMGVLGDIKSNSLWDKVITAVDRFALERSIAEKTLDNAKKQLSPGSPKILYFIDISENIKYISGLYRLLSEDQLEVLLQLSSSVNNNLGALRALGVLSETVKLLSEIKPFDDKHLYLPILKKEGVVIQDGTTAKINLTRVSYIKENTKDYLMFKRDTLNTILEESSKYAQNNSEQYLNSFITGLHILNDSLRPPYDGIEDFMWMLHVHIYLRALNSFDCSSDRVNSLASNPKELARYVDKLVHALPWPNQLGTNWSDLVSHKYNFYRNKLCH